MATSPYRDQNSVTTLMAIANQLTASHGIDLTLHHETTINRKYNVLSDYAIRTMPRVRWFGIGIRGYANITSENNIAQPFAPSEADCDLYEPIPFRAVTTPLDEEEAAQYAMRQKRTIDGTDYYLYWLKRIEFESNTIRFTKIVGDIESTYTLDAANLYPVPSDLFPTDIAESQSRISASVTGICRITGAEVSEVINVLYGGDLRKARISEFGTYSGVLVKNETHDGFPAGDEVAYAQLCTHKCTTGVQLSDPTAVYIEKKVFEHGAAVII